MFIPDLTTTWNVNIKSDDIDEAIETIQSSPILSVAGDDVLQRLTDAKSELEGLATPVAQALGETQKSYQEQFIQMNQSIQTGNMMESITLETEGEGVVHVGNTASSPEGFPYPLSVEYGRGPVYPINKKVLRWFEGGNPVFRKSAGPAKPRPFIEPSQSHTMSDVERIVDETLGNALR